MLQVFEGFEPYLVTKGQHDADVNSHHHANPVDTMVVNMTGESSCGPVALPKDWASRRYDLFCFGATCKDRVFKRV